MVKFLVDPDDPCLHQHQHPDVGHVFITNANGCKSKSKIIGVDKQGRFRCVAHVRGKYLSPPILPLQPRRNKPDKLKNKKKQRGRRRKRSSPDSSSEYQQATEDTIVTAKIIKVVPGLDFEPPTKQRRYPPPRKRVDRQRQQEEQRQQCGVRDNPPPFEFESGITNRVSATTSVFLHELSQAFHSLSILSAPYHQWRLDYGVAWKQLNVMLFDLGQILRTSDSKLAPQAAIMYKSVDLLPEATLQKMHEKLHRMALGVRVGITGLPPHNFNGVFTEMIRLHTCIDSAMNIIINCLRRHSSERKVANVMLFLSRGDVVGGGSASQEGGNVAVDDHGRDADQGHQVGAHSPFHKR